MLLSYIDIVDNFVLSLHNKCFLKCSSNPGSLPPNVLADHCTQTPRHQPHPRFLRTNLKRRKWHGALCFSSRLTRPLWCSWCLKWGCRDWRRDSQWRFCQSYCNKVLFCAQLLLDLFPCEKEVVALFRMIIQPFSKNMSHVRGKIRVT